MLPQITIGPLLQLLDLFRRVCPDDRGVIPIAPGRAFQRLEKTIFGIALSLSANGFSSPEVTFGQ
jgi:hypothetical protein